MNDLAATGRRLRDLGVRRAELLIDRRRAEANIAAFAGRAAAAGIALRPHFKTHQSAGVAAWFRAAGVDRATVSSAGMAAYFAGHGWGDLTLAIPANPLEIPAYDELAGRTRLGLCVDNAAAAAALAAGMRHPFALWLEIDTGHGRTGIVWDDADTLIDVARQAVRAVAAHSPVPRLAGLLTHGGQSYRGAGPAAAAAVFAEVRDRLQASRKTLTQAGIAANLLSAGDTPGFAASSDWSGLDEARPGNFVFYDLMQLAAGACRPTDLACAVACPVIGVYPSRAEAMLHGGAVHLSCESLATPAGPVFGRLLGLTADGFAELLPGWEVTALSQEHGRLAAQTPAARSALDGLQPGDLVLVAPVHACLTCEQFGSYRTLDGDVLLRYRRD